MAMCIENTAVEWYPKLQLYVKREDLCCPGGPNFSKTRGVYAHIAKRKEKVIGVLDTSHSQGGWAVAKACSLLNKHCVLYYPVRKGHEFDTLQPQQKAAKDLGATLVELKAGRSFVLYHRAKADLELRKGYMMPNALKLSESVYETAAEFGRTKIPEAVKSILISVSSGTIAAGVILGAWQHKWRGRFLLHMGYSRSEMAVLRYIDKMIDVPFFKQHEFIDEGYNYADAAKEKLDLPFPSNSYYDGKAAAWWVCEGQRLYGAPALLWNIG